MVGGEWGWWWRLSLLEMDGLRDPEAELQTVPLPRQIDASEQRIFPALLASQADGFYAAFKPYALLKVCSHRHRKGTVPD